MPGPPQIPHSSNFSQLPSSTTASDSAGNPERMRQFVVVGLNPLLVDIMLLFIEVLWCIFETTRIAMRPFLVVFVSLLVGGGAALAQTVDPSGAGPCGGQSTYTYNGEVYRLAEIGDQCWFADNLRSNSFQNGDAITYANSGGGWTSFGEARRGVRENNNALAAQQGYLYNFIASRCPRALSIGISLPTTTDFNNMVAQVIQLYGSNDNALFRAPEPSETVVLGWERLRFGSNLSGFTG